MAQISTKQGRRPYPIIKPAEDMPDIPEYGARARAADVAGQIAFGLGLQFKRQQEEDKIEADNVSALNAQVALDKYDYDERKRISTIEFGQIEDFDNTYNEYTKGRQSYTNTLLSGKNEDVKQSIKDHALKTEISSHSQYYNQLDRYKTRFAQTQFFLNKQTLSNNITPENIEQTRAALRANINSYKDFFTPAQINAEKKNVDIELNNALLEYQRNLVWNNALATATDINGNVDWQKVLVFLNQPKNTKGVDAKEVDNLIENAQTQFNIQNAVTDKSEYWRMLREITKNPQESQRQELIELAERGELQETDRKYLEGLIDKRDDPLKSPSAQLYMGLLDAMYSEVLDPKKTTKLDKVQEYDIKNNQLRNWLEKNPDATPEQTRKFFSELLEPELEDWVDKAFNWWVQSPFGVGYRKIAGIEKKVKEGEEDLSTMTDEELEAIIRGK